MSVILLADEPAFALGDLTVRPALRQVVGADGSGHVLEPRVMQVLVALARAQGAIVSRDKLIEQCWEGRIVGEDAINRVIGRLRQFAQADAAAAFRIDTVPRVGYRLVARDQPESQIVTAPFVDPAVLIPIDPPPLAAPNRRMLLVGAGAACVVAAGGAAWWFMRPASPPVAGPRPQVSPEAAALFARALAAARRNTPDGGEQALALYKQVLQIAPDYADAWGAMAETYAYGSHAIRNPDAYRLQARAAITRTWRSTRTTFSHSAHRPTFIRGAAPGSRGRKSSAKGCATIPATTSSCMDWLKSWPESAGSPRPCGFSIRQQQTPRPI